MSASLGLSCNFYREPWAIHGLLESASSFFDDMLFISAPPKGAPPDDETIAIIEKWGARIIHTNIDEGFGVVRTMCLRESTTEWVMVLDADERLYPIVPVLDCEGTEGYPQFKNPSLATKVINPAFNQGQRLRHIIDNECDGLDGVVMSRRHWFDFSWKRPCQNWKLIPDVQLRCVRNDPNIYYKPEQRMHEHLIDGRTGEMPKCFECDTTRGPFIDHFNLVFKGMEPENNAEDMRTYQALDKKGTEEMWLNHYPGVAQP